MKHVSIQRLFYPIGIISAFVFGVMVLIWGMENSTQWDFIVFYNSARAVLLGNSIYAITGSAKLPFWYFPWTAWFFIPLAIWPFKVAISLFTGLSIISGIAVIYFLTRYYNSSFKIPNMVFIVAPIIPMSFLLIIVGQMDYILLGMAVVTMYAIDKKHDLAAGLIFPFLWIKPHLLIVFTLFALWRSGKRAILISLAFSILMLLVETAITPDWPYEMLNLLKYGAQRTDFIWNFTTLPNLLGSQENWVGTANLPFTILLIVASVLIVWKFRALPTMPLLSLALAASLFCAPRAYAYDLPLLIPALIWLTAKSFPTTFWIWLLAALIPMVAGFSSGAYLLTLLVFSLSIWKARQTLQDLSHEN
jgi:hypothetical protein